MRKIGYRPILLTLMFAICMFGVLFISNPQSSPAKSVLAANEIEGDALLPSETTPTTTTTSTATTTTTTITSTTTTTQTTTTTTTTATTTPTETGTTTEQNLLLYASYFGGTPSESGTGIVVDSDGNFFIVYREHLVKIHPNGTVLWDFYFTNGNYPEDIALDNWGNVYITGGTHDTAGDAFLFKINATGYNRIYSIYLEGSAQDYARSVDVDSAGNAYVAGYTFSDNFPVTSGAYDETHNGESDCFITKINATGEIVYSTFFGGTHFDEGYGIAVDSEGHVFVTGTTKGTVPLVNPYQSEHVYFHWDSRNIFVSKLTPSGNHLLYSTYVGGACHDFAFDIAIDDDGYAYVLGDTGSQDFPTVNAYDGSYNGGWAFTNDEDPQHSDCVLFKLNPRGDEMTFSTYFGGGGVDTGYSIALNDENEIYITGYTISDDFPLKNAYDPSYSGGGDCFVSKFTSGGDLLYSTFLGGRSADNGFSIAVDSQKNAYITGSTRSDDFPTINAADTTLNGTKDCFVVILADATGQDLLIFSPVVLSMVLPLVGISGIVAIVPTLLVTIARKRPERLKMPSIMKQHRTLIPALIVIIIAGYAFTQNAPGPLPPPSNSERFTFSSTAERTYVAYESPYVEEDTEITAGYHMEYLERTAVTVQFIKNGIFQFEVKFVIGSTAWHEKWEVGKALVNVPEGNYTLLFSYYVNGSEWGNPSDVSRSIQVDIGQDRLEGRNSDQMAYDLFKLLFLGAAGVFVLVGVCDHGVENEGLAPPPRESYYTEYDTSTAGQNRQ